LASGAEPKLCGVAGGLTVGTGQGLAATALGDPLEVGDPVSEDAALGEAAVLGAAVAAAWVWALFEPPDTTSATPVPPSTTATAAAAMIACLRCRRLRSNLTTCLLRHCS
jgi:hypothetical protein